MKGTLRMASLIFVLVFTVNYITTAESKLFKPEVYVPPPVNRSTESSNRIFAAILAAWDRIQEFVRNGMKLGRMGLSQTFDQLFIDLKALYPMMIAAVPLLVILSGIIFFSCQLVCDEEAKTARWNIEKLKTKIERSEDENARLSKSMAELTTEVQRLEKRLDKAVADDKASHIAEKNEKAWLSKIAELTAEVQRMQKQLDKAVQDSKAGKDAQKMVEKELKKSARISAALEYEVTSLRGRLDIQNMKELSFGTSKREEMKGAQDRLKQGLLHNRVAQLRKQEVDGPKSRQTPPGGVVDHISKIQSDVRILAMAHSRGRLRTLQDRVKILEYDLEVKVAKIAAMEAEKKEAERKMLEEQIDEVQMLRELNSVASNLVFSASMKALEAQEKSTKYKYGDNDDCSLLVGMFSGF